MPTTLNVHGARPTMGYFRREWVAPEISEANWKKNGVVFRDQDGAMVFAIVSRVKRGDSVAWWVSHYCANGGGLRRHSCQEVATLREALDTLAAEVDRSRREFGIVSEAEWPKDCEPPRLVPPGSRGWASAA
jgi:hypothetical protein